MERTIFGYLGYYVKPFQESLVCDHNNSLKGEMWEAGIPPPQKKDSIKSISNCKRTETILKVCAYLISSLIALIF